MLNELRQLVTNSVLFRYSALSESLPLSRDFVESQGRVYDIGEERLQSLIEDEAFYWQPTPLSWY
ncbi:hypothetical protein AB4Z52_17720 [Rhizobium sp. 2YAF20]|uniref:hypothetical protein n=1 Tax=Rhizobium sp. 2YAF20 TaxID=3233027 RepID=UPI003F9DB9A4